MSFFDQGPPLRAKICGITGPDDAEIAIAAGADAVGINFYPGSKRFVEFSKNRKWIEALAGRAQRVAVVVNPSKAELGELRDAGCFEAVQFHGDETPDFCAGAGFPTWIRAVRIKDNTVFNDALTYQTPYLLLDAWSESAYGGTGHRLNWDIVRDFVIANPERRVILAGGLTPHNVRDAVRIVRPHGVDVASGVELEPRKKNEYLVREFIAVARSA
jgi:phosphoribosylanthranilate isomerase